MEINVSGGKSRSGWSWSRAGLGSNRGGRELAWSERAKVQFVWSVWGAWLAGTVFSIPSALTDLVEGEHGLIGALLAPISMPIVGAPYVLLGAGIAFFSSWILPSRDPARACRRAVGHELIVVFIMGLGLFGWEGFALLAPYGSIPLVCLAIRIGDGARARRDSGAPAMSEPAPGKAAPAVKPGPLSRNHNQDSGQVD